MGAIQSLPWRKVTRFGCIHPDTAEHLELAVLRDFCQPRFRVGGA